MQKTGSRTAQGHGALVLAPRAHDISGHAGASPAPPRLPGTAGRWQAQVLRLPARLTRAVAAQVDLVGWHAHQCPCPGPAPASRATRRLVSGSISGRGEQAGCLQDRQLAVVAPRPRPAHLLSSPIICISSITATSTRRCMLTISTVHAVCAAPGTSRRSCPAAAGARAQSQNGWCARQAGPPGCLHNSQALQTSTLCASHGPPTRHTPPSTNRGARRPAAHP